MNSQKQLKEEPLAEYHIKRRKLKRTISNILFITAVTLIVLLSLVIACNIIITLNILSLQDLVIIMKNIKPYLWLSVFYFIIFLYFFVSYFSITSKIEFNFIYYVLLIFLLSALFWNLSNKNYNLGYYSSQTKYEMELIRLTEDILNSNISVEQQQEYLKILFSQHNAQIKIYQKDLKDNVIYKQDFQINQDIKNYKLDTEFISDIILKQKDKKYVLSYTSYQENKNISPFLSAITLNAADKTSNSVSLVSKRRYIANSLSFFVPFFVLWFLLLIYLKSSLKNKE